jgi:LEA14-like dessication related protein
MPDIQLNTSAFHSCLLTVWLRPPSLPSSINFPATDSFSLVGIGAQADAGFHFYRMHTLRFAPPIPGLIIRSFPVFMASRPYIARHPFLTLLWLFLFLLLVTVAYGFYLYKSNEGAWLKPDLQKMTTTVKSITKDSLKMDVAMTVRNSLPITLRIDSMAYKVALEGDTLIQGAQHEPTQVKGSSTGEFKMPMNLNVKNYLDKLKKSQRDSVDVYMLATMYSQFPVVGSRPVPIEVNKKIYIPKLPKIEVEKVRVANLNLKGGQLVTTLKITNYESFPFTIQSFAYRFRLSDDIDVKGRETENIEFKKTGVETIDVPVDLKLDEIGEAAFKMLFKSKTTPYRMDGTMQISSDQNFVGNMEMAFNSEGTIGEMKDLLKQASGKKEKEDKKDDKKDRK